MRTTSSGRLFAKIRSFLGHGLLTSPAPVHCRDRLFLQPVFNSEQVHRSVTVMRGTAQSLSESWRPGQIVRIDRAMYGLAMSRLLALRDDDGNGLSLTQIRDHLVTFAIAGVETTGTMLAWVFHELGHHPQTWELLHAELDAVLHGRPPEFEDLERLEYTNRIVNEVLRLHHGWIEIRRAKNTVRLGNVEVPAGRDIAYSPYGMQRDPRWFPNPGPSRLSSTTTSQGTAAPVSRRGAHVL
ncbi:cytochrome P450 [Streptomyces sp. NPDC018045]|uniref:cytochrome P450 n=1 Tax=Streptomyces sp. NPDC018045 TaxID=3365037 RepID=UPI0037AF8406